MIKKIIYTLLIIVIGVVGYFGYGWYKITHITPAEGNQNALTTKITLETVMSHNDTGSCWMTINKKVYDVTNFIVLHPGGSVITQGCGKEATELFKNIPKHAKPNVDQMLTKLWIGNLVE